MIDIIQAASTLQFVLGVILIITGIMIVLQAAIRHGVWSVYLILFFGSLVGLAVTLR